MTETYLIMGAARSGIASAEYLLRKGHSVVMTDLNTELSGKTEAHLGHDHIRYIWGSQPDVDALAPDVIVVSPGIPLSIAPIVRAKEKGIPVISEPELAWRESSVPIVAVTGTNGKTTTTTLTAVLLKQQGREVLAGGNIGVPLIAHCPQMKANDIAVAEMSSFQLESIDGFRPHVAVVLNVTPDHLDRHKTMEAYAAAKARIFENQGPEDALILNADDAIVSAMADRAKSRVFFISQKSEPRRGMWLDEGWVCYRLEPEEDAKRLIPAKEIGIVGAHNLENAMAASTAALIMGQDPGVIADRLRAFRGVEHRMEPVAEIDGVLYVNDSKGTNPDSTRKALVSYDGRKIVLIAGGYNKGNQFDDLVPLLRQHCRLVVLVGKAVPDFLAAFERTGYKDYVCTQTFEEAVSKAHDSALPNDVVLLSPACASWDMFDNFEQRGDLFKKLVKAYAAD